MWAATVSGEDCEPVKLIVMEGRLEGARSVAFSSVGIDRGQTGSVNTIKNPMLLTDPSIGTGDHRSVG